MSGMKSLPRFLRGALALLLLASLAACGGGVAKVKLDTKREYANAVRWSDWDSALKFIDPAVRLQTTMSAEDLDRLKDVKVTGYEVKSSEGLPDGTLNQTVTIRYVDQATQIERSKRVVEHWRLDEEGGIWWLTTGLPEF